MYSLVFLEPGHFHAALTLRAANRRVAREVHVYARPGAELDAFTGMVASFNARAEEPTGWEVRVHASSDPEDALIGERAAGDIVIVAGRNQPKLGTIARLHRAGFHVLADKPWLTDPAALPVLEEITSGAPLAMDIMTTRHEVSARLAARLVATPEVFGEFVAAADGEAPAIEIEATHHLLKMVSGKPLRRPAWYYDTRVQGSGLVDLQSHMTDQAQWLVGDGAFDFARDFRLEAAVPGDTLVSREVFRESTGLDDFPDALRDRFTRDGALALNCNGELRYRLRGVAVCQRAMWLEREPPEGGDIHRAAFRGARATIHLQRGRETGFRPELHVVPEALQTGGGDPEPDYEFGMRLQSVLDRWQEEFPGLACRPSPAGFELVIPRALATSHESHFSMVLDRFLDHLDGGSWPADLAARIRARYTLLARACELAAGRRE